MEKTENTKQPKKSLMTMGPTLHYSHANVNRCYWLTIFVYCLSVMLWSKLMFGSLLMPDFPEHFRLEHYIFSPVSIFEYPAQIFVIGLLVSNFITIPILTSHLMSFKYSIIYILLLLLVAKLPGLALAVFIGSLAASMRPFRFRSRYISIALCSAPALIYFVIYGGVQDGDSIKWALSFAPWIYGFLSAMAVSGVVILIGHFTRYRPGLIWSSCIFVFIAAAAVFQIKISLAELDYQLYIAANNPEAIKQFHSHSITALLDETINAPDRRRYFQSPFYPEDPIALRIALKQEIQNRLVHDRWPEWFAVGKDLQYQEKKAQLLEQYEKFINPKKQWYKLKTLHNLLLKSKVRTKRMPIALYYKAMLSEISPELNLIVDKELLWFYNDYSHKENLPIWHRLGYEYPKSPEAIEARKRKAVHLIGMEKFDAAKELIALTLQSIEQIDKDKLSVSENLSEGIFKRPHQTVISEFELKKIKRFLLQLNQLISDENITDDKKTNHLLAQLVLLNPHDRFYKMHLENMLAQIGEKNPISDNIMLAQILLIPDAALKQQRLDWLAKDYGDSDGGIAAQFEAAVLKLSICKEQTLSEQEKEKYLRQAKTRLQSFIKEHPKSIFAEQAEEKLSAIDLTS